MASKAELRGLEAVERGDVFRTYYAHGNTLKGRGVSSTILWRLDRARLIGDAPASGGHSQVRQDLTMKGRDELRLARASALSRKDGGES
jgi:hypothetical protein